VVRVSRLPEKQARRLHHKETKEACMARKSWRLPRRTFLRGTGAAIALPLLDVMRPLRAIAAGAASASGSVVTPVRMAFLYFPNGAWNEAWVPKKAGAGFELPFSLSPLDKVQNDVCVLSGLDKAASHQGDGHYAKTANFLTGAHVNKTTGSDISAGGISIDQLAAQKLGDATPLPSMELGIDPVVSGIDNNVGYTRLYASYISWRAANLPVAREINPRAAYDRLFGSKDEKGRPTPTHADDDCRLLDMALEDAGALRRKLGRDDRVKVDEYLEAVRAVEKQVQFVSRPDNRNWKPTTKPTELARPDSSPPHDYQVHVRLMLDLLVLAFWTDSTRIGTFMFANDVSGRNFAPLIPGVSGSHHETSHHQNVPAKIEEYKKINRWHVEQFARVLEKMRTIKEGDKTLLDNSMVLFGSSMSDGNRHDPANLPLLLGGRAGGSIHSGRHVASPAGTPLCNLYVSMLDRMGIAVPHFGDSTGKLAALES
jgi:hypothetical protein